MPAKIAIDEEQLRAFMRIKPTLKDTAAWFRVSEDTIDARCKEFGAKTFADFRDQNMVHTRHDLIREAIRMAMNGNSTMMIFCLKNLCQWRDRYEEEPKQEQAQTEKSSELIQLAKKILADKAG